MIDTLHELANALASGSVTVDALVTRLGPVAIDHGPDAALDLRSTDARFSRIQLFRDAESGLPASLELDVTPATQLTVGDLTRAFGAFKRQSPAAEGRAPALIFQSIAKDAATASLVARVAASPAPLENAPIATVQLIREPRLD